MSPRIIESSFYVAAHMFVCNRSDYDIFIFVQPTNIFVIVELNSLKALTKKKKKKFNIVFVYF